MGIGAEQIHMSREVMLNRLTTVLADLDYPCVRERAAARCEDVTLLLADGTENLGRLIALSGADSFESMDELVSEVMNLLPRHAVGEPYQSEGEG